MDPEAVERLLASDDPNALVIALEELARGPSFGLSFIRRFVDVMALRRRRGMLCSEFDNVMRRAARALGCGLVPLRVDVERAREALVERGEVEELERMWGADGPGGRGLDLD